MAQRKYHPSRPLLAEQPASRSVCIKRALWRHYKPLFNNSLLCPLALFLSLARFCANLLSFAQKVTMAILALYSPMISPPARPPLFGFPHRRRAGQTLSTLNCTLGGCCAYATGASRWLGALHNRHIAGAVPRCARQHSRPVAFDRFARSVAKKGGRRLIHHAKLTRRGAECAADQRDAGTLKLETSTMLRVKFADLLA